MIETITNWDVSVLQYIQHHMQNDCLTPVMRFITSLGDRGILWIALVLILLIFKQTRRAALTAGISLVITFIIVNLILKPSVARIRPYDSVPALIPLVNRLKDYSFPSGHTANGFAVALPLFRMLPKKYSVWPVILNVMIAYTRLYLMVHYPSDVIVAFLIALVISSLVWYFAEGRKRKTEGEKEGRPQNTA